MESRSNNLIVLIEENYDERILLTGMLAREGFSIRSFASGEEALRYMRVACPVAVIMDTVYDGVDGLEICRRLRALEHLQWLKIIFVASHANENDEILAFETGADDFVCKPVSDKVLAIRVHHAIGQTGKEKIQSTKEVIHMGNLYINLKEYRVCLGTKEVNLTRGEFRLLWILAHRPGGVFSRAKLLEESGTKGEATARSVDVRVVGLRKKLGSFGNMIRTVRGVGYRLEIR